VKNTPNIQFIGHHFNNWALMVPVFFFQTSFIPKGKQAQNNYALWMHILALPSGSNFWTSWTIFRNFSINIEPVMETSASHLLISHNNNNDAADTQNCEVGMTQLSLNLGSWNDTWQIDLQNIRNFCRGNVRARSSVVGRGTIQAGRSPVWFLDDVDFFNLPNPSSHTMALGSTQPLTEMR
jgi:hypothetical protein